MKKEHLKILKRGQARILLTATGKKIELPACQIIEIADGKVKSMRQYFDMATMMQQLGITA